MRRAWICFGIAALSVGMAGGSARASIIFSDDFDGESLGLNYNSFANWTVSDGTVDTVGTGFFDFLPGNGVYVDLDGSTNDAGVMTSNALSVGAGGYVLSFDLAGSQRGDTNTVVVSVGTTANPTLYGTTSVTLGSSQGFTNYTLGLSLGGAESDLRISFANAGGDQFGALLDRVVLSTEAAAVPEPSTIAAAGLGALALARFARRRKSA